MKSLLFFLLLVPTISFCQLTETFSDGEFSSNPAWTGDNVEFIVNVSNQLQLNNTVAGASYLSTPLTLSTLDSTEWRLFVKQTFAGSGSNYGRIYLVSDQANLEGALNGYYLQFGEAGTNDAIELFKQSGTSSVSVCRGTNATLGGSSFAMSVKVTRNNSGLWELNTDYTGGTNYSLEASGTDVTYTTSAVFGVVTVYTVSNSTKFFYDDISVTQFAIQPLELLSATTQSSKAIDLLFSEAVDTLTAQNESNYVANNSIGNPISALVDATNKALVHLSFSSSFTSGLSNQVTVSNVTGLYSNAIGTSDTASFTYFSPYVAGATLISSNSVDVAFSQNLDTASAQTETNYNVNNGVGSPSLALVDGTNKALVHLSFPSVFPDGLLNTITVTNVTNVSGDIIGSPDTATFTYFAPVVITPHDLVINEIYADNSSTLNTTTLVGKQEFVELYNRSNKNINIGNWQLIHTTTSSSVKTITSSKIIPPGAYVILTSASDTTTYTSYGTVAALSTTPSITNGGATLTLKDNNGQIIDAITFSDTWYQNSTKKDGGYTLERIDPTDTCGYQAANWIASTNTTDGGTPGAQNSVFSAIPDNTGPVINGISIVNTTTITICFNEGLDSSNASFLSYYQIDHSLAVIASKPLGPDFTCVELVLSSPIVTDTLYTVTISNVTDCRGNPIVSGSTGTFIDLSPAPKEAIVINEIYADNSSTLNATALVGVQEFIELYNRSTSSINIENWVIYHNTTPKTILSKKIIPPGGFVIVTSVTDTAAYNSYGVVAAINSSMSLTNGGAQLILKDNLGKTIDEVTYSDAWYKSTSKKDGGYTLERINPNDTCKYQEPNWIGSNNTSVGGTPGTANSVLAATIDNVGPVLAGVEVTNSNSVQLCFDEGLDSANATNPSSYLISNGLSVAAAMPQSPDFKCVVLIFSGNIDTGTVYTVTVNTITDCRGNVITTDNTGIFAASSPAVKGDLVFNEIMADPDPVVSLPPAEYVEIYNRSNKIINVGNWFITMNGSIKMLTNKLVMPHSYLIVAGSGDTSLLRPYGNITASSSSLSLTNSGATLELYNSSNILIDEITYTSDWHNDDVKKDGGWSLEKINPDDTCSQLNNWSSSTNALGGSPGTVNSILNISIDNTIPNLLSSSVISGKQIEICFNEALDTLIATSLLNYQVKNASGAIANTVTSVLMTDNYNSCLQLNLQDSLEAGITYTLVISQTTDCKGNTNTTATNIEFGHYRLPRFGEVVINEVMADPEPVIGLPAHEYMELYNKTSVKLSLEGLNISAGSSSKAIPYYVINPGEYVMLVDADFATEYDSSLKKITFPSFLSPGNTSATLTLADTNGRIIHTISYDLDWYHSPTKENGGWSLEQIDYNNPCGGKENWSASVSNKGGTPGEQNSVYKTNADVIKPELQRINVISKRAIELIFNEPIDSTTMLDVNNYSIDNGMGHPVIIDPVEPAFTSVILTLPVSADSAIIYTVTVSTPLTDCAGNSISSENSARFGLPKKPWVGDVVINELLSNPNTGGADYVELYNKSDKVIDVQYINFSTLDTITNLLTANYKAYTNGWLMFPGDYLVFTENPDAVKEQYIIKSKNNFVKTNLPTYSNDEGMVVITDYLETVLEKFTYRPYMQFALLNSSKGVSLERINPAQPADNATNWHSAAEAYGFGTPGYQNSQFMQSSATDEISLSPDIFSPDMDGYNDVLSINYKFSEGGKVANIKIYDSRGRLIKTLKQNEYLGTEGTFNWDGIADDLSKAVIGAYVVFVEVYALDGTVKHYKKSTILASKL